MTDPGRQRRGWHDHVARSVVVDVRPVPADEVAQDSGPPHIVNLTAMRLVPSAPPAEPVAEPAPRASSAAGPHRAARRRRRRRRAGRPAAVAAARRRLRPHRAAGLARHQRPALAGRLRHR